jgi:hypothetical protein
MYSPIVVAQEIATADASPSDRNVVIRIFLGRVVLGVRQIKGWVLRGGGSRRLIYSEGRKDSCEMRKLFGGHVMRK